MIPVIGLGDLAVGLVLVVVVVSMVEVHMGAYGG
jgi:hypothetical protein